MYHVNQHHVSSEMATSLMPYKEENQALMVDFLGWLINGGKIDQEDFVCSFFIKDGFVKCINDWYRIHSV